MYVKGNKVEGIGGMVREREGRGREEGDGVRDKGKGGRREMEGRG